MGHLVKFVHSATGIEAQQTQLLLIQFCSLKHFVWKGSKFKTLLLFISTCTFSLLLACTVIFSLTKKVLPVLEQNNMERKLPLEADYAERGAPGPMAERKYSCPRKGTCPAPHFSLPPQLSQC